MKIDTLGFLELNSISRGIEAADSMLKVASVQLIWAKASCPGKYYIVVAGQVAEVEQSLKAGVKIGAANIVGNVIIPRISEEVIRGINQTFIPEKVQAIGIMEYYSCTGSIFAADAAVKAADVRIMQIRLGTALAGKSYVVITGDVGACQAAVEAGIQATKEDALLIHKTVIPKPQREVFESLVY
jgi:microcompartment protein CcmL/EutN